MKKVIRLTESDLTRIVKRVINEGKKKVKGLAEGKVLGGLGLGNWGWRSGQ